MKILVASENPAKIDAVKSAFSKYFDKIEIDGIKASSNVSDTPLTEEETLLGVKNRMKVLEKKGGYDFKVSVEAGTQKINNTRYLFTWVLIEDSKKKSSFGRSLSYPLPTMASREIEAGKPLSEIAEDMSEEKDIRSKGGFVEFVSKGVITRAHLTEDAVICALFPFVSEQIYK